jgi:hypothetical protein
MKNVRTLILGVLLVLGGTSAVAATPYEYRIQQPAGHRPYGPLLPKEADTNPGLPVIAVVSLIVALVAQCVRNKKSQVR